MDSLIQPMEWIQPCNKPKVGLSSISRMELLELMELLHSHLQCMELAVGPKFFFAEERWLSGLKRRLAKSVHFVSRVRIPSFPTPQALVPCTL